MPNALSASTRTDRHDPMPAQAAGCSRSALGPESATASSPLRIERLSPVTFYRSAPRPAIGVPPRAVAVLAPAQPLGQRVVRKRLVRRRGDSSQLVRHAVQGAFLLLNLWIGARFYFFVRYYETSGATVAIPRPPGVEGWLPIAGLMNLKYWLTTGSVPTIHPAGLFLFLSFIAISVAFRKAFCSWLCPVGTLSEWLWQGGRDLVGRNVAAPRWLDVSLRGLKYLLLAFFAWAVAGMSTEAIRAFLESPYGVIADVKMLNFFRDLGLVGASAIAVLVVASVFVKNAWCRYLCPYGALLGLVSLASFSRIRREPDACIDCGKCAKACPSLLPVDRQLTVKSPECTGCLECVAACPAAGALDLAVGRHHQVSFRMVAVGIVVVFLGIVAAARLTGHWDTSVPESVYFDLVPKASSFGHPPASGR